MNNSDMPAMPVLHTIDGNWVKEPLDEYKGLTKREDFAKFALMGILSNPTCKTGASGWKENIALDALELADALLAALEAK